MAINYNFRGVGVRIPLIMAITSSVKQLNVFFFRNSYANKRRG